METYGYTKKDWKAARDEARQAMIEAARRGTTLFYSQLVGQIESITFTPHDFNLFHLLGQISTCENESGRGMLSVVVVRKQDGLPGQGFFDLARDLGRDTSDPDRFFVAELGRVLHSWQE
jgi:hypothetical protein